MEYTKGDRVLFGNGASLLEGVVQKIYEDDGTPMILITGCSGSSFMRLANSVISCTLNQARASQDMHEALKEILNSVIPSGKSEILPSHHAGRFLVGGYKLDRAQDALTKAEGK